VWFSDAITPSIHGEALKQSSTLAEQSIQTNAAGRLTQVQETPAGKGCTTRQYAYDEEGDRTSLSTHEPGSKGECTSEGGAREAHVYDAADRLNDVGVTYDALDNVTVLPAVDAGGHELKSSYYVDNQVASQEQEQAGKAKTISFSYDPAGRTRETLATGQSAAISHYAGPGEALSWSSEGSAIWSRNIPGIDGTLCATQSSGGAPVLQLHDLQGNIVATASLSETETKLLSTYSSTEFGVPQPGTSAPKYAWLGAAGLSSELPSSGVVTTGASSYVPEIGRALQSEAVASPGAFPDGTGGGGIVQATYWEAAAEQLKAIAVEHEAALEAAARKEAEERAFWEACPASACHVDGPGEGNLEGSPEPSEGGNEAGEETFGDPLKCYVGGTVASAGETATIAGYGGCNQGLPAGTWIKVCVYDWPDSSPYPTGGCSNTLRVEGHTSKYWSIGTGRVIHCSEGDIIRGYVAFWVPGGRTLYAGTEQGECTGSDESVWEALTPWQALPGGID